METRFLILICSIVFCSFPLKAQRILSCQVIWSQKDKYAAFTTLVKYEGDFYCAFRVADSHVDKEGNDNGEIIILRSKDTITWKEYDRLSISGFDLRDPKLCVDAKGRLSIMLQAVKYSGGKSWKRKSLVISLNTLANTSKFKFLSFGDTITDNWLWDMKWIGKKAYGFLYIPRFSFVESDNGLDFRVIATPSIDGVATEASLALFDNEHLVSVVRVNRKNAMIGLYNLKIQSFQWYDSGVRLDAPVLVNVGNEIYVCGRYFRDNIITTSIFRLNKTTYKLEFILDLPSGGDCAYPGLVYEKGLLYISYYNANKDGSSEIIFVKYCIN